LAIHTSSRVSVDAMTKFLARNEEEGFMLLENGSIIRTIVSKMRRRRARTTLTWVKNPSESTGSKEAGTLASAGCAKTVEDDVKIKPDTRFILPGVKLQAMTQSKAYKMIQRNKRNLPRYKKLLDRNATNRNMELTQAAVADPSDELPPRKDISKSTAHKDISRSARFFLWMMLHGGYKAGPHWTNIPGHEDKAECKKCGHGVLESMEHILTKCEAIGQEEIWRLASELWKMKTGIALPPPSFGQIMGCAAIKRGDAGTTRLFRIMSAHLIWKVRNERVIQGKPEASLAEVQNRWRHAINNGLKVDCAATNEIKYGKKAIKKELVLKTWSRVLKNEELLPKDWTRETRVLVGI
ncbi:hypothetical protein K438DRAFT_1490387, partial [Mycena galopus ATCC 62051]